MEGMGRFVLVLSPWLDPIPLTRLWCVWEIYCAHETGCSLDIVMPPREAKDMADSIFTGPNSNPNPNPNPYPYPDFPLFSTVTHSIPTLTFTLILVALSMEGGEAGSSGAFSKASPSRKQRRSVPLTGKTSSVEWLRATASHRLGSNIGLGPGLGLQQLRDLG